MKRLLFPFALTAFVCFSALAQDKSVLELLDIFNLEYISDPQIAPSGDQIVYVRNFKDIMTDKNLSNIWIVNADGSRNRPLTTGNQNDSYPRWSPDGSKIIFKSNKEDDRTKLYLMWLDTRQTLALTNGPQAPQGVSWAKNSDQLAFNMFVPKKKDSPIKLPSKPEGAEWNKPPTYIDEMTYRFDGQGYLKDGNDQLFTLSVSGGTPVQHTFSDFDHGMPHWSADQSALFFSANLHDNHEYDPRNSEVYRLDLASGTIMELTNRQGPDHSPVLSPDGSLIAFSGFDDRYQGYQVTHLYVMKADGSEVKDLTPTLDRDVTDVQWEDNGKGLYFMYDEFGETKIGHVALTGKVRTIVGGLGGLSLGRPYNQAAFTVSKDHRLAYTLGGTEHPADLALWDKGEIRRVTALNDDLFAFRKLGKVEEIRWKSSFDQREIQGWLVTPPDFDPSKKYPLILEIHGGPFSSYGPVFSAEIQLYAAAGYTVLYTNPRGSTSYGEEFGNLIHHDYPNHDYEDLMSGVDAAIEKGFIDESNLFVTGGSGGGVLTAWIVGKTERFRAAVVAKPVINWYSFVLYADNPGFFYKYWFPKKPWEDPSNYLQRSPLSYVGNVTTPTMLLTGEEDYRTPIAESEQFYAALKLQKVETAMVRIPGASHGIADKPSNLVAKISSVLTWFEKYRTGKDE
jgi:acylaminoacyl-peptidase